MSVRLKRRSRSVLLCGLAVGVLGTGACAQRNTPPPGLELRTLITAEDMKLFELVFPRTLYQVQLNTSERNRDPKPELSERRMRQHLDQVLQTSGYCREGYSLLGRSAGQTVNRLRGECRERADQQDRARFPNTIVQW